MNSLWIWIIIPIAVCISEQYRQERAKIVYYNPKYVQNAQAFTGRRKRGEPYKTNITANIISPWNNNVTMEISYRTKGSPVPLVISTKYCDILKTKWLADFINAYSARKLHCPLPPGQVRIINMELPPKNFPLPIPKGDIRINITISVTQTKEVIMLTTLVLHST